MPHVVRATAIACGLALALSAHAAKSPRKPKPEPVPAAPVEIDLAHELGPAAEERLNKLIEQFNSEQKGVVVKATHPDGGRPAPLNLMRRQEVADLLGRQASVKPLYQFMGETKLSFSSASLSSDLRIGASDEKGRLVALPVAYSTPVLFYDKNAFRKAGLDPEKPPRTWWEMQETAGRLFDGGSKCPYTTSWPTWIHIDNLSALSSASVASPRGELAFNGLPQVKHVAMLASWSKARYFHNFGRRNEADKHFASGECAMITTDSSAHAEFRAASNIDLGVAPMPHHDDVYGGRQHTLADGASLWIGGGYKPQDYKAAASFVSYLLRPEVQAELARIYGQVPLTSAARSALRAHKDADNTFEVAYGSLKGEGASHPLRISAVDLVRVIVDEELEAVWDDQKPAKAALDTAVARGNAVLAAKPALKKIVPF